MADKKISELNTAAAVFDTDDFALVQDSETKQVNASAVKAYVKDGLSKADVGLGSVDNIADADKPISTATQTALDGKEDADATILKDADIGVTVQAYDVDLTDWAGKAAPTGDAVGTSDIQILTNKTISGADNTLSNIGNSSLTNSSITINGNAVSLGGSTTVTAATTNTLTIGTGLSGTSFDGSAATTIAIDSSVVTLTGTQTLTNKTFGQVNSLGAVIAGGAGQFGDDVDITGDLSVTGLVTSTTLSSTGNTTLGDAAGDTLTINGTAVSAPNGLNVNSNQLVLSSGNVGIGTSSPTTKLEIRGNGGGDTVTLQLTNDGSHATRLRLHSGHGNWSVGNSITVGDALEFRDESSLITRMLIDSSGNVGIGTSSPLRALHVNNLTDGGGVTCYGTAPNVQLTNAATEPNANTMTGILALATAAGNYARYAGDVLLAALGTERGDICIMPNYSGGGSTRYTRIYSPTAWYPDGATQAMTLDASGQLMLGTTTASTYANTGKVLTVSGSSYNTAPANLYLQGSSSAPGRGFNSTEVFALSGVYSANEITRITGTGPNGFRAYIKIIVTGHTSGVGNGINIKEFYWDGGATAPVQISTYTDGQIPPITFNYSTSNVLIIYVASANGTSELKGVMKVEWLFPNDFGGSSWVIS